MNTLVVYDSLFGNTERIAQAIADALRAFGQVQAIRVEPAQPDELKRQEILRQYRATDVRLEPAHQVSLEGVDLLIVGGPTQAFRATPTIESFLENVSPASLSGMAVACFDTRARGPFGSAAKVMAKRLQTMGVSLLLPPESFFVKGMQGPMRSGEVERAATWARMVFTKAEASHPAMRR
jgi:flavodoxin I